MSDNFLAPMEQSAAIFWRGEIMNKMPASFVVLVLNILLRNRLYISSIQIHLSRHA